ncbi:hypothetical protein DT075_33525 [Bacillus licheniformis]|nr:hypothetical protein DT075_33525 [Bacillus licheniformis]
MKKLYISAVLGLLFVFVGGTKIHAQEPQNNNGVLDENKFIDETVYSYTQPISSKKQSIVIVSYSSVG